MALALFALVFVALLLAGFPVAWTMVAAALTWLVASGQTAFIAVLPGRIFQGLDVFVLMAVPLFILAGELVNEGRITERLIRFSNQVFGWLPGGLAQVNIGASLLFSGITGVALGDIAALGRVFIPEMVRAGYTPAYAAAVTASSSIIGPMIPPSLIVVIYGSVTGVSIGGLFAGCIVPGLLIGLVQMLLVWAQSRRLAIPRVDVDRSPRALAIGLREALPPLVIPVIVLAGILGGVMTPTEAGGAAALYAALIAALLYRSLSIAGLARVLRDSALFSSQLLVIVGCGAIFTWVMGMENVPARIESLIEASSLPPVVMLLLFNLILLVVGMFIDPTAAIILFIPVLSAAAEAAGIDPLHFGVIVILNLNIGLLTPPLGVCLFAAQRIANCGFVPLLRATAPFVGACLVALAIVTLWPAASLALPRALGF